MGAASLLVHLIATVAELGAVFTAAFVLCVWALEREEGETPAYVLAACHEGTELRCILAVLWRSRDVLARLVFVSWCLDYVVLRRGSEGDDDDDGSEGLEGEVERRGQSSASMARESLVRRHPRAPSARATTAEQVHEMAPGTARPSLPVLHEAGAVANAQQPRTGRSAVLQQQRAPTSRSAPDGPDASHSRSALLSRSTGPRWSLRDAVRVSLSRSVTGPPGGARRASMDPTGQRRRRAPAKKPRRVFISSGSRFYENVVLRQVRELALQECDEPSDDGGDS